jgi:two-component system NtrC family sensor kinase
MARIAVINDDTAFLQLMLDLLTDVGYDVSLHKEGAAAHEQVRQEAPDLIILDIRLEKPDSGWMVLEMVRLDPTTKKIPVIVCSADTIQLQTKQEMLRAQGCEMLEKPFDLDALLKLVDQLIGPPSGKN